MISNPFFLVSILISSLIAFATVAIIVETFLKLFRFKQARWRACLRLLPYMSLFLDLLFNSFSISYWLNPLSCSSCIQKLLLTFVFPELKNYLYYHEISLLTYLGSGMSHTLFSGFFVLFVAMILYSTSSVLLIAFRLASAIRLKIGSTDICLRPLKNTLLSKTIQDHHIKIFSSDTISIPMATYSKAIFIPKKMIDETPQSEFEAIIAHELEHILWKDPTVRFLMQLTSAIFWWVPTHRWQKKLEFDQEVACDQSIREYGLNEESLASALIKVAREVQQSPCRAFCYFNNEKHSSLKRVEAMFGINCPSKHYWMSYLIALAGFIIGFICVLKT